jgi:hypothetical protein
MTIAAASVEIEAAEALDLRAHAQRVMATGDHFRARSRLVLPGQSASEGTTYCLPTCVSQPEPFSCLIARVTVSRDVPTMSAIC